jgi:paraquat-inducible protein B
LRELSRTAAAFRTLAEYLERHPEALIRGKPAEEKP